MEQRFKETFEILSVPANPAIQNSNLPHRQNGPEYGSLTRILLQLTKNPIARKLITHHSRQTSRSKNQIKSNKKACKEKSLERRFKEAFEILRVQNSILPSSKMISRHPTPISSKDSTPHHLHRSLIHLTRKILRPSKSTRLNSPVLSPKQKRKIHFKVHGWMSELSPVSKLLSTTFLGCCPPSKHESFSKP